MPDTIVKPNLAGLPTIDSSAVNAVPTSCLLDTAAAIGFDANTSYSAIWPGAFQVNPVAAGTVVQVQWKIHKDAAWLVLWDSSVASNGLAGFLMTWQTPPNFVRAIRLSGVAPVKAYATIYATDSQG